MQSKTDMAVVIGRFQPFHKGHEALIRTALELSNKVVIILGSAFSAPTIKNPFNVKEREEMIRSVFTKEEQPCLNFVPIRDYNDSVRWVENIKCEVNKLRKADDDRIAFVVHLKDESTSYARDLPISWERIFVDNEDKFNATDTRAKLFGRNQFDLDHILPPYTVAHNSIFPELAPSILLFLSGWRKTTLCRQLVAEFLFIQEYKKSWEAAPYPPIFVTVDAIVKSFDHILLIRRKELPGKDLWAMPGGFVNQGETLIKAVVRELREETSLEVTDDILEASIRHTIVLDSPSRSLRGRTISHAYLFDLTSTDLVDVTGQDDAAEAKWIPIEKLLSMEDQFFDDHFQALDRALNLTAK